MVRDALVGVQLAGFAEPASLVPSMVHRAPVSARTAEGLMRAPGAELPHPLPGTRPASIGEFVSGVTCDGQGQDRAQGEAFATRSTLLQGPPSAGTSGGWWPGAWSAGSSFGFRVAESGDRWSRAPMGRTRG